MIEPRDASETRRFEPGPAARFVHHHKIANPLEAQEDSLTLGQRLADRVAQVVGSWPFIIVQSFLLVAWMAVNVWLAWKVHTDPAGFQAWDPYPFILLNLVLSFQAAYTGPVVMMSQNRQSEKDRLTAQYDFKIDSKAEQEIRVIMEHLSHQDTLLIDAIHTIEHLQPSPGQADLLRRVDDLFHRMELAEHRLADMLDRMERLHPGQAPEPGAPTG